MHILYELGNRGICLSKNIQESRLSKLEFGTLVETLLFWFKWYLSSCIIKLLRGSNNSGICIGISTIPKKKSTYSNREVTYCLP